MYLGRFARWCMGRYEAFIAWKFEGGLADLRLG